MTAELVNRNVKDPNIRRSILAEMRWINAVLRKESGAAISAEEYSSMGTQYFPRAGDDEASIQDKLNGRSIKERGLKGTMGPAGLRLYNQEFSSQQAEPEMDPMDYYNSMLEGEVEETFTNEAQSIWDSL